MMMMMTCAAWWSPWCRRTDESWGRKAWTWKPSASPCMRSERIPTPSRSAGLHSLWSTTCQRRSSSLLIIFKTINVPVIAFGGSGEWGTSFERLLPLPCVEGPQQDVHQHTGGVRAIHAASWRIPAGAHHLPAPPRGRLPGQDVLREEGWSCVSVRLPAPDNTWVSSSLMWGSLPQRDGQHRGREPPWGKSFILDLRSLQLCWCWRSVFALSLLHPAFLRRKQMRRKAWGGYLTSWLVM